MANAKSISLHALSPSHETPPATFPTSNAAAADSPKVALVNGTSHKSLLAAAEPGLHRVDRSLYLKVGPRGRSWVFRFRVGGRLRSMGLGAFPETKLSDARDRLTDARKLLSLAVDPIAERRERMARLAAASSCPTFRAVADEYIGAQIWKNAKHCQQWANTLETYAHPKLGAKPADSITRSDVLSVLTPIWQAKPETASRVRQRIERVLSAWAARSHVSGYDNPARWKGALDALLPSPKKAKKVEHHAALPFGQMHAFMSDLRARDGVDAACLEFVILTACRSSEARLATWSEFDLDQGVWHVPGERMKHGRDFDIPLSARALELVTAQQGKSDTYVFSGTKLGAPINQNAMLNLLESMKVKATVHGFRSTCRDWMAEATDTPNEVAEMVLGHAIGDATEAAYRRGDLFVKRAKVMQAWAVYCATKPATVATIGKAASHV